MTSKSAKYTLWTIPRSEWSEPLGGISLSSADAAELISFAENLDDAQLDARLRPFDTPITQDTLSKAVS